MSANAPSWRHHYVPQFYLRCWADSCSGMLWQCKREASGKLGEKPVPTKATGYQRDLYTASGILPYFPERSPDSIERDFFAPLDNAAAIVLGKLVRDLSSLNAEERSTWALFLNSLLERHPAVLERKDADAHRVATKMAEEVLARCPTPESRARMAELLGDMDLSAIGRNTAREHMVREICDPYVLRAFLGKQWKIVHVGPVLKLITSDRPLVINCGYSSTPIEMLTISLSPSHLFLMHPLSWEMDEEFLNSIIAFHNLTLIEADNGYLYSMGRIEDGPIVMTRKAVERFFDPRKLGRPAVVTRSVAETAHCWFNVDRVSNDPETTAWKRTARLRQARWREARGFPIGAEPYAGGDGSKPVGSRLALDFAKKTPESICSPLLHWPQPAHESQRQSATRCSTKTGCGRIYSPRCPSASTSSASCTLTPAWLPMPCALGGLMRRQAKWPSGSNTRQADGICSFSATRARSMSRSRSRKPTAPSASSAWRRSTTSTRKPRLCRSRRRWLGTRRSQSAPACSSPSGER